ncbi:MAG: Asp-tRNA(Asn)/Glu-tRNA(Gln) amidotransferase subunit GatC [Synergistaceae bacterium]|uniref:Asp-tRNA(Asn)/Glu-tRNA(Gln) amidotransferase subunit GatC n=1 Tax=Aminivibrio sp. TaxID=1872489 RepID=UPI00345E09FE|nr:Asp-tRNA(Asn)/Glu-tRNA(Gln) amidotransferase subunit GatC [Synergistaceae bacterium]
MTISEKDVRHVADLARLHVEDEEIGPLVRHFEAILGHFSALSRAREEGRLVLDRVDPFLFAERETPPLRDDIPVRSAVGKDVLASAPLRKDTFFVVPRILEEE